MKRAHRISPQHRRDWRQLWRYCRCGYRWRCPDSVDLVPVPYAPTVPPLDRAAYPETDLVSAVPPARVRAGNQRSAGGRAGTPGWRPRRPPGHDMPDACRAEPAVPGMVTAAVELSRLEGVRISSPPPGRADS
ncbi:hypothetical protein [Plantactinospora sp. DSM 117369]